MSNGQFSHVQFSILLNISLAGGEPWAEIIEQPQARGYRFRYHCEGNSHGGIQGVASRKEGKTYPTIKIHNYRGPARVRVTLVTDEAVPRPHPHELMGKSCVDGVCTVDLKGDNSNMVAHFPNLGIRHVTRKRVIESLTQRILEGFQQSFLNGEDVGTLEQQRSKAMKQAEDQARSIQLNTVKLSFQVLLPGSDPRKFTRCLRPVISTSIHDSKSPGAAALKICRMDKNAGCCVGNEEVFLLCDRVQKEDIIVRFFKQSDDGQVEWEAEGMFGANDVHRQYAIVFKTPQYKDQSIKQPVHVHVQLRRRSDGESSEAKPFTYYPLQLDQEEITKKKRKLIPHFTGNSPPTTNSMGMMAMNSYSTQPPMVVSQHQTLPNPPMYTQQQQTYDNGFTYSGSFSCMSDQFDAQQLTALLQGTLETDSCVDPEPASMDMLPSGLTARDASPEEQLAPPLSFDKHYSSLEEKSHHDTGYMSFKEKLTEKLLIALHAFAGSGDVHCLLLAQRYLVAVQDNDGDNCIHKAVIHNQLETLRQLLHVLDSIPDKDIQPLSQYNSILQTPLHIATLTRQTNALKLLLCNGADLTTVDRHGNTIIHMATKHSHEACLAVILEFLTERKAKDTARNALDMLNFEGFSALHLAVLRDDAKCVKLLIESKLVSVNLPDGRSGRTALHHAVDIESMPIVGQLVIDGEADVNVPAFDGNTALHIAVSNRMLNISALLVALGADCDAENLEMVMEEEGEEMGDARLCEPMGLTPKDYAHGDEKMLRILNGEPYSDITQESDELSTESLRYGSEGRVRSFMEAGTSVSAGDLDRLDSVATSKLCNILDVGSPGHDWREVCRDLGLAALTDSLASQPSPFAELLKNYDALDGTLEELTQCLRRMGLYNAVSIIEEANSLSSGK
ncbi:hypothetical protein CAPTEDRAFT_181359 [Capitella teleta]|uniref:RHD domain-containing protein n=1 Tax=Capitella teleta TaxID=283909 RepID=R7URF2_CAPTE|nr:hypothetical protein CAPTEDRAFT_181359 [Capitella teleta]|eukprot:ELU08708.1 hypothetical protein CAPTEDRAFT_181359 [Capitella teleta]